MRARLLAVGMVAAVIFPSAGFAQVSCEQQNKDRTTTTVAGGGVGALIGGAVAGRHDRAAGAIIGAIGGAILANQMSKAKADCAHAFGYYDGQGAWHANADRSEAVGYFDRSGQWVAGAPSGYYDSRGQWQTARGGDGGYNDNNGRWVPARATGYYDDQNRWLAPASAYASVSTESGRSTGYDSARDPRAGDGRQLDAGQPQYDRRRDYADNSSRAPNYESGGTNDRWDESDRHDLRTREDRLRLRITEGRQTGELSRSQTRRFLARLQSISDHESRMPHRDGRLSSHDEDAVQAELDRLASDLRGQVGG